MTRIAASLLLLLGAIAGVAVIGVHATGSRVDREAVGSALRFEAQTGVPGATVSRVRDDLRAIRPVIDADFGVRGKTLLTVRLFATHAAFARGLRKLEGVWPEGGGDTMGNVVDGILPLGPPNALLRHDLAHVYTEWVLDRLTHNWRDRQPDPAWLYDGIAEWEANRRLQPLRCALHGKYPIALTVLAWPRQWWRTRASPFQELAYCEARVAATRLIDREGFPRVRALLHSAGSWQDFVRALLAATRPASW